MSDIKIIRTQEEIDELISDAYLWKSTGRFRGMTFEQGLDEMFCWLTDTEVERPLPVFEGSDEL